MKKDNYYNINNNIKMSSPVNTSYRLHQSQTSSPSSIHNHDKNKIIDNNHNKVSPQNTHINFETVVFPINPHHQSDKEINQVLHDSNPYKQTVPKSNNKRTRDHLYIPNKKTKSVIPIQSLKFYPQKETLENQKIYST